MEKKVNFLYQLQLERNELEPNKSFIHVKGKSRLVKEFMLLKTVKELIIYSEWTNFPHRSLWYLDFKMKQK